MTTSTAAKKEVSTAYDSQVSVYEARRFSGVGGKLFDQLERRHAILWLRKCNVLHIGTATGRFAEMLPTYGLDYCGIEISSRMAIHTKKRGPRDGTEIIRGDGEVLPLISSSFDNVLSVRSFHFLPEPRRFLREAYRILQPGGRLIVSFETFNHVAQLLEASRLLPKAKPTRTYHTLDQVRQLLRDEGFNVIWSGKVTKFPLNFYWKFPPPLLRFVRRIHEFVPDWFGTVGSVVGEKGLNC